MERFPIYIQNQSHVHRLLVPISRLMKKKKKNREEIDWIPSRINQQTINIAQEGGPEKRKMIYSQINLR